MLRNSIIVAAVVASISLTCRAQVPAEQPSPQIKAQAELRANMAAAQDQARRMQQAADDAAKPKEDAQQSHRVQVLLLEINANAEHPKLTTLRAAAQSGKATAGLIALADELIAAGVGFTDCNVSTVLVGDNRSEMRNEEEVPFVATSGGQGQPAISTQGGTFRRGYWCACRVLSESDGMLTLDIGMESSGSRDAKTELPGLRAKGSFKWNGAWAGRAGSEAVLVAASPRKPGNSGGDPPKENYLLLRVDIVE